MQHFSELFSAFDLVDANLFVIDMETYDLVFCNRKARATFGISTERKGPPPKCYECLQSCRHPCVFCDMDRLRDEGHTIWFNQNPVLGRDCIVHSLIMHSEGHRYRLELAVPAEEADKYRAAQQGIRVSQGYMTDCIRHLVEADSFADSIDTVLQTVMSFYHAARAYLFEFDWARGTVKNTYEMCAPGVSKQISALQAVPNRVIDTWIETFRRHELLVINNIDAIRLDPRREEEYRLLRSQDISNVIIAPIFTDGMLSGFVGLDNPEKNSDNTELLKGITYFIGVELNKSKYLEELRTLNYFDPMTGLGNRNAYTAFIARHEKAERQSAGAVFLDMNGLKYINDNFGHDYGDRELQRIGGVLLCYFPKQNVFRISGDEFVAFELGSSFEAFNSRVNRLKHELIDLHRGLAAQGAAWDDTGTPLTTLQNQAEKLMYAEKHRYYQARQASNREARPEYIDSVVMSLQSDHYIVYLQPKFDLHTLKARGAEALVRKLGDDGKIVMPNEFIHALEKENAVAFIDFFVFEKVCETLHDWDGLIADDFFISSNFSRETIVQPDFVQRICDITERTGVTPKHLVLEITEATNAAHLKRLSDVIDRLEAKGFRFSLDDFGTEYATLEMLKLGNLNSVKFDISLIRRIHEDPRNRLILQSLVDMCHRLHMECIAEGVETESQLEVLREIGCDRGQGYLVDKPMPVEDFKAKYISAS